MRLADTDQISRPKSYVEHIFPRLDDQLNQHLIKLAGFDFPPEQRQDFRAEIRSWLRLTTAGKLAVA
jgi:hypothetical protein